MYTEIFSADTKMRTRSTKPVQATSSRGDVKSRLEAWLKSLDPKSPYRVLGCAETDGEELVRERYRALARKHHPDAGGDPKMMQSINEAWKTIVLERRADSLHDIRVNSPVPAGG
jgi:DnaJ-class molecular chaperone